MFVKSITSSIVGIDAVPVSVEANLTAGIGMYIVGLPDSSVKESQERIRSAFGNSGFRMTGKKLVVNLAPADLRKEGSYFDLPIAVSILAASEQIPPDKLAEYAIMGELSLDGTLLPVRGVLPVALMARREGLRGIILPEGNAPEAAVVSSLEVIGVRNLKETADFLSGEADIKPYVHRGAGLDREPDNIYAEDFADVKGQEDVKRALEIAASGGHNIIMIGSPGSGKTMLARRIPTIMPHLTADEALETMKIHSVAGKLGAEQGLLTTRPFRTPHHLASRVALIGGGTNPHPGEISLAHNGVLYMDELPEFGRNTLEVLRQPLEDGVITIARSKYTVEYPARFILAASMNPCPCGYYNHPDQEKCKCPGGAVKRYMGRISGPLMDRIDMHIEVTPVSVKEMGTDRNAETSAVIRERVERTRNIQRERFAGIDHVHTNAMMNSAMVRRFCRMDSPSLSLLEKAMDRLNLSARAYDRIIKVARTIADMACSENITSVHISEAINFRSLDRESWGDR